MQTSEEESASGLTPVDGCANPTLAHDVPITEEETLRLELSTSSVSSGVLEEKPVASETLLQGRDG